MQRCSATTAAGKRCKHRVADVDAFCASHKGTIHPPTLYRSLDFWPSDADRVAYLTEADGPRKVEFDSFCAAYKAIFDKLYGDHPFQLRIEYARYRHMGLGDFNCFHAKKRSIFRAGINKQEMWNMMVTAKNLDQGDGGFTIACKMCNVPMSLENYLETEGFCSYACASGGGSS